VLRPGLRGEAILPISRFPRRGARVADRGGLENRCACERTVGSNPTLSATSPVVQASLFYPRSTGLTQDTRLGVWDPPVGVYLSIWGLVDLCRGPAFVDDLSQTAFVNKLSRDVLSEPGSLACFLPHDPLHAGFVVASWWLRPRPRGAAFC
jgi:hypothetical protein